MQQKAPQPSQGWPCHSRTSAPFPVLCRKAQVRLFWSETPKTRLEDSLCFAFCPAPAQSSQVGTSVQRCILGTANIALTRVWCSGLLGHLKDENLMAASSSKPWKGQASGRPTQGEGTCWALCCEGSRGHTHPRPGAQLLPGNLRAAFPRQCVNVPPRVPQLRPGSCCTRSIFKKSEVLLILLD